MGALMTATKQRPTRAELEREAARYRAALEAIEADTSHEAIAERREDLRAQLRSDDGVYPYTVGMVRARAQIALRREL